MLRQSRKLEHIECFLKTYKQTDNGFSDVKLIHHCLSDFSEQDICLQTKLADINLENPIIINAITGGDDKVLKINKSLAEFAKKANLAMAVGSQYAAIKNPDVVSSYKIVRKINPDGIVFANIGAYAAPIQAQAAVDMIDAQALQIHLNIAQELFMVEGDRDFSKYLDNIRRIVDFVTVPVIVKETGCGICQEAAVKLLDAGVKIIDISARGGSNFVAIETSRVNKVIDDEFLNWGLTTAVSTLETKQIVKDKANIISSGGIVSAFDIVKSLSCGADAVAIAGLFLQELLNNNDIDYLCKKVVQLINDSKKIMLLMGCADIKHLHSQPIVITGFVRSWLEARGIDIAKLSLSRI